MAEVTTRKRTRLATLFQGNRPSARISKAITMLGGAQVFNFAGSIIRIKLVALWIGPIGIGLFSIFNNTLTTLLSILQSGYNQSAVRQIAAARNKSDFNTLLLQASIGIAVLSTLLLLIFARPLSSMVYGDTAMTPWFRLLGAAALFTAILSGLLAILQANGKITQFAKAQTAGAVGGLAVSVPLFYFLRQQSIVPSIVAYSFVSCIVAACFVNRQIDFSPLKTLRDFFRDSSPIFRLGLYLTATVVATLLSNYAFMLWLNREAGTWEVGVWQAGYTITDRYVGILFSAIALEYYPRISSMAAHPRGVLLACRHEASFLLTLLLIAAPLLSLAAPWVIDIFYTSDFMEAHSYVAASATGLPLRAASFCLAFVILAHGNGTIYLITEITSAALYFVISIFSFRLWGISGLGYGYAAWYTIYFIMVAFFVWRHFQVTLARRQWILLISAMLLTALPLLLRLA